MLWQDQGHLPCLPGLMARFVADFLHGKKKKKTRHMVRTGRACIHITYHLLLLIDLALVNKFFE